MRISDIDWRIWAGAAAFLLAVSSALYWLGRRKEDPEAAERRRRAHVNQVGRIAEGRVVEVYDASPGASKDGSGWRSPAASFRSRKMVSYSYAISGVTYETAQDITGLEGRAGPDRLVAGRPASVKYDPANPTNSILVADDWSGLR